MDKQVHISIVKSKSKVIIICIKTDHNSKGNWFAEKLVNPGEILDDPDFQINNFTSYM